MPKSLQPPVDPTPVDPAQAETTPATRRDERRGPLLPPLRNVLAVAAGGAVGGSLRYSLIRAFPVDPGAFPWVIFLENVTGAFLLGLILALVLERWRWSWDIRPFLTTGILGSFTTFSNLTLDVVSLGSEGLYAVALAYSFASLGFGVASAFLGVALGHALAGGKR